MGSRTAVGAIAHVFPLGKPNADVANGMRRGPLDACPGWSESSVKSALYRDVNRVKGYGVRTETFDDGTQRYHLVPPKGVEAPLGHVEPATVKKAANRG